jgi:WD40 repeat protein
MRVAERRLARSLQIAALLAVAAGVAGTGAWLEHQRLARETARRVQAEATLEALARQTLYSANLNRAQRGLETGDYSLARRALAELKPAPGDPDTRGFEWKVLWDQIQGDSADVTQIPGRSIDQLFSSADGRLIAGRLDDNRTEIWDADSLKVRSTIEGVPHLVGFTPDGLSLVGTDRSSRFCRWSLRTGEMDAQQSPYLSTERPVAPFGPEGMISMSSDDSEHPRTLRVWDFGLKQDTLVVPVAIEDPKGWDFVIASLSRDQRICAVAMTRYTRPPLYLWRLLAYDMTTGKLAFDRATNSRVTAVALSSTGKFIAYALVDSSEICVDDIASGAQLWKRQVGVGVVRTIRFSPDDRRMAIGGHVSSLLIVDSSDGKPVDAFVGQDSGINETVWNSATGQIFSAGAAGDLRHWHEDGTRKVRTFPGFFSVSFSTQPVCVSDDGRFFAAPTAKNILVWCAIDSLNLLATGLVGQIPLGFDPDSMGLSAVDEKGTLYHYRKDARGKVAAESMISLVTPETGIEDACWSANHKVLVVAGRDGSVNFFNLATGSHRSASGFKRGAIGWANISGDGAMAITGGLDGMVRLWATKSGKATLEWPEATIPFFAAFSPDSSFVAICFQNGEVEIRNLPDGKILKRYKSDLSTLEAVAFLPDGKRLFIGGSNGSVQVLNCQNWQSVITLNDSGGADTGDRTISRLSVSATGNTLMAYRADGRLTAWHYDPSAL